MLNMYMCSTEHNIALIALIYMNTEMPRQARLRITHWDQLSCSHESTLYKNVTDKAWPNLCHIALLDSAGLCWTLLDSAGLCWTLLDSAGLCWT